MKMNRVVPQTKRGTMIIQRLWTSSNVK